MRKVLSVLAVLAALGATSAMAAGMTAKTTGTIKSIDSAKNEVILQDGKTFTVAKNVDLKKMKPGEKVTVTYTQSGKTMDATQINKAP